MIAELTIFEIAQMCNVLPIEVVVEDGHISDVLVKEAE